MNIDSLAQQYCEDGFAMARHVFSADEISELQRHLHEYIRTVAPRLMQGRVYYDGTPRGGVKALHQMEENSAYFEDLRRDERLVKMVGAIFAEATVKPCNVMFFDKLSRSDAVSPPHQDNTFQCWDPPEAMVATIAVDRSTPDNGVLICHRGSHRSGLLPHRSSGVLGFSRCLTKPVDEATCPAVELCMDPGDVALHSVNTIHHSGPNRTNRSRRQVGIGYISSRARRDERAWAQYQEDLERLHAAKADAKT